VKDISNLSLLSENFLVNKYSTGCSVLIVRWRIFTSSYLVNSYVENSTVDEHSELNIKPQ
jgi:hypothetical protein